MSMSYGMNIPTFRSAFMDYNYTKHQRQEMDVKSTKISSKFKAYWDWTLSSAGFLSF